MFTLQTEGNRRAKLKGFFANLHIYVLSLHNGAYSLHIRHGPGPAGREFNIWQTIQLPVYIIHNVGSSGHLADCLDDCLRTHGGAAVVARVWTHLGTVTVDKHTDQTANRLGYHGVAGRGRTD